MRLDLIDWMLEARSIPRMYGRACLLMFGWPLLLVAIPVAAAVWCARWCWAKISPALIAPFGGFHRGAVRSAGQARSTARMAGPVTWRRLPDFDASWIEAVNVRLRARRARLMDARRAAARPWIGGGGGDQPTVAP